MALHEANGFQSIVNFIRPEVFTIFVSTKIHLLNLELPEDLIV